MNPLSVKDLEEENAPSSEVESSEPERDLRTNQLAGSLVIGMIAGFMFGTGIGFIPTYFVFNTIGDTCTDFTGQSACESATFADCVWTAQLGAAGNATVSNASSPSCKYSDFATLDCGSLEQSQCTGTCRYLSSDDKCVRASGLSPLQAGLFSSSYFVGCTIGPMIVNHILSRLRFRPALCVFAVLTSIGGALCGIARATDTFPLLLVGFLMYGFGTTAVRYSANLFVFAANEDRSVAGRATSSFQPLTEFAQLCAAFFVFFQAPTDSERASGFDAERRIQTYLGIWHVQAVAVIVVSIFLLRDTPPPAAPDEPRTPLQGADAADDRRSNAVGAVRLPADGIFVVALRSKKTLLVGISACAALLFTGLPAISAYVPVYSQDLVGLENTVAPLVTTGSGAGAGLLAFAVRRVVARARPLMLTGVAALFFVQTYFGMAVFPGVVKNDSTRNTMAISGIVLFYAALEICVGSTFFELSLSAQPPQGRSGAGALLNSGLNSFSVITSFVFPIAVAAISGSESVRLGWAVCLFFFAFVAALCFAVQYPLLRPWVEGADDGGAKGVETPNSDEGSESRGQSPAVVNITVAPVDERQQDVSYANDDQEMDTR